MPTFSIGSSSTVIPRQVGTLTLTSEKTLNGFGLPVEPRVGKPIVVLSAAHIMSRNHSVELTQ